MAKAVLVLDEMPKRCFDCKLRLSHIETFCIPTGKTISELWEYTDQKEGRPDWCPLKELPERKTKCHDAVESGVFDYGWATTYWYETAWNECLDAIENGEGE